MKAKLALDNHFNPFNMPEIRKGTPNENVSVSTKMSLDDIEAINECFPSGKFSSTRWLSLCFPSSADRWQPKSLPQPVWADAHSDRYV